MGYATEFCGQIEIKPSLNAEEISFIQKHNQTRRMKREKGAYFVDGSGMYGQGHEADVTNYNEPPERQLSLWCGWTCTDDGKYIEWDGGEKFYSSAEWMKWLISHILGTKPKALAALPFLQGHILNGEIEAHGEDREDRWKLIVNDNVVKKAEMVATYGVAEGV